MITGKNVHVGNNVTIGDYVIIEDDVFIGNNVKIGHRVTLKTGAHLCDNVVFDDHCIATGACWIGEHVNIRTGAIISKANIIEDYVFIGPGVVTNHTKHVTYGRPNVPNEQLLTYIGYGSVIGSQASLLAGLTIGELSIIGGGSVVVKNTTGNSVWVGSPAKKVGDLPGMYYMNTPSNTGEMYKTQEILNYLKKYIPNLKV